MGVRPIKNYNQRTMTQEDIMLNEKELERLKHALGMDNKDAVHGIYEAYRRSSVYNEPIKEWDNLVRKGFATKSVVSDNQISYRVTEKGMKKVADATGLMIKYTLEFEPNPDLKNFTLTQEEKELLLIDLSARLPYGVKCDYEGSVLEIDKLDVTNEEVCGNLIAWYDSWSLEKCKPYLRPMSSMTKKEKMELCKRAYVPDEIKTLEEKIKVIEINAKNVSDFYNEHHFDYRGLIEKGLAIEAPEDMYKITNP